MNVAITATEEPETSHIWAALDPAGIVLHSVPPIGVLCAAEAAPWLRDRLTEAVHAAARETPATQPVEAFANTADTATETGAAPAREHTEAPDHERAAVEAANTPAAAEDYAANGSDEAAEAVPANARVPSTAPAANTADSSTATGRKLLADYVAEARAAHTPGTEVTPAWVRQVTDCARSTSAKVAAHLRDELAADTDTPAPVEHGPAAAYAREAA